VKHRAIWAALSSLAIATCTTAMEKPEAGWIPLFDGKSLDGWKINESPDSVTVQDGAIVCKGERAHLFYVGPVASHEFKNFELKLDAMTTPGANSGVFFHTRFQETGWPTVGYEAQVNSSHGDWRRTGSLYDVADVRESPSKDNEWFHYHIMVLGKRIVLKVNGKTTVDYTEPDDLKPPAEKPERRLSRGTFALQVHPPADVAVYYKNIMVRPLPDTP